MSEFIFFHIQKCGGTSLRYILYEYFINIYEKDKIFIPENSGDITLNYFSYLIDKIKENEFFDFPNIKVILSHIYYNDFPDLNRNCKFKFTCVRKPISRIISHYYFFIFPETKIEFIDLTFECFESFCLEYGNQISNILGITNETTIDEIDKRLKEFNYIAILENIDNDLITLNKNLNEFFGVDYVLSKLFLNKNENKDKNQIKDIEKLYLLLKKYCSLDELVYDRIIFLKNNKIIK